jgi:hypothetical protein
MVFKIVTKWADLENTWWFARRPGKRQKSILSDQLDTSVFLSTVEGLFTESIGTPDHILLDSVPNIGPLIPRWELEKFQNCWNKSFRTFKILTLLCQQFLNLLISQRGMSGPRLGALSNNRWWGYLSIFPCNNAQMSTMSSLKFQIEDLEKCPSADVTSSSSSTPRCGVCLRPAGDTKPALSSSSIDPKVADHASSIVPVLASLSLLTAVSEPPKEPEESRRRFRLNAQTIQWGVSRYHVSCANLWLNRVNSVLPAFAL